MELTSPQAHSTYLSVLLASQTPPLFSKMFNHINIIPYVRAAKVVMAPLLYRKSLISFKREVVTHL